MRINVCLASDTNYADYMKTTIKSVLMNANPEDELSFFILSNKIPSAKQDSFQSLQKIKKHDIKFIELDQNYFAGCPVFSDSHITITMYYRYMIANLLPDIDKIIYLDCDTIVETSLQELFETNIDNYDIAAVEDIGYTYQKYFTDFICINSGVLLINLKKWRENNTGDILLKTTIENPNIVIGGDQDIINYCLHDKCLMIDYKWNVQDSFFGERLEKEKHIHRNEIESAAKAPCIIHYTGPYKPWKRLSSQKAHRYWRYQGNIIKYLWSIISQFRIKHARIDQRRKGYYLIMHSIKLKVWPSKQ